MREAIIIEAIPMFLQYGFKSVTVDDIALKMSVSKKTIYTHFPKKEQLVETSVMRHFEVVMDKILSISQHSKDPIIELYLIKKEALNHLSNEKNSPVYQLQKYYKTIYQKLKEKEFKELYETTDTEFKNRAFVKEVTIDTDFEILFPDDYVNNITERLNLYTKLNEIKDQAGLEAFQKTLEDRFGELPSQVISLFDSVRIKWIAIKMGIERVIIKQDRFIGYFISDQQSDFYQTQGFSKVLDFAQNNASKVKIKEKNTRGGLRLLLTIENVSSISKVLDMLEKTGL